MRIAHIIMVHKNAAQVERLVRQLHHEDADIYVHIDKKPDAREFAGLFKEEPACFPLTRNTCNWGGFSFLKAVVSSVREVIGRERRYDFVNLLSGQDYPLVSASA